MAATSVNVVGVSSGEPATVAAARLELRPDFAPYRAKSRAPRPAFANEGVALGANGAIQSRADGGRKRASS